MRVAWIAYLDPYAYSGGGELSQRMLIEEGRRRGHVITLSPFLRRRPQRIVRRSRLWRHLRVDWSADVFILSNLRNAPHVGARIPSRIIDRTLNSGRAVIHQQAWVDVCPFDLPCAGQRESCRPDCSRDFADSLYSRARVAVFNSQMQRDAIARVLGVPLPPIQILEGPLVDADLFKPSGAQRDIDVLYVGTINADKGYYNLLERFGPDRLTFVGPNHLGEPVQGRYLGRIPHGELPAIYSRARIFAHLPRWLEPMGRTVVEAALCGCEIVVNDRVGVTSLPSDLWRDRDYVRNTAARFWEQLEAAY